MPEPRLPNLVINGAMKSATTSLNRYLGAHPEIHMAGMKELDFFVKEQNWNKGLDWYRSWFRTDKRIVGEASPNYAIFPFRQGVPERMHSVIPEAKLIYLLRDPIQRMVSHYHHCLFMRRERRTIDEALTDTGSWYFHRSKYFAQLEQYAPFYEPSNPRPHQRGAAGGPERDAEAGVPLRRRGRQRPLRGVRGRQARRQREEAAHPAGAALQKALDAVRPLIPLTGRARGAMAAVKRNLLSRSIERPLLSQAARDRIAASLADDIAGLRAYTGREFEEWSV